MASPFKRNKKARRRGRKIAAKLRERIPELETTNPAVAASVKHIVELITRIDHAKRKPKRPQK